MRPIVRRGWPLEAFLGDVLVCQLEGEHLDQVTEIKVSPAGKGVEVTMGDPFGRLPDPAVCTSEKLTVTFEVKTSTYPGEKRIVLYSPEGESDPLPFLIMM